MNKFIKLFLPIHWPPAHLTRIVMPIILILVGIVGLDQYTKRHVQSYLIFYQDKTNTDLYQGKKDKIFVLGEKKARPQTADFYFGFNFHYSRNKGAAFNMFSGLPDSIRIPFFNMLSILAVIVIIWLFMHSHRQSWLLRLGLVMIFAGGLGNFLDRLLLGYVIDFIDLEWHGFGFKHEFAVFNIADIAISVGAALFIFDSFHEWRREWRTEKAQQA